MLRRLRDPNDQLAWEEFWERYGPWMHGWCLTFGLHQTADAENVVQEFLLRSWNAIPEFVRQQEGSFRSWLKTCIYHAVQLYLKRSKAHGQGLGTTGVPTFPDVGGVVLDVADEVSNRELEQIKAETRRQAVERLRRRVIKAPWQLEAYLRREGGDISREQWTHEQLAKEFGQKVSAVSQALPRIKRMLQEESFNVFEEAYPQLLALVEEIGRSFGQESH
jgi:RNA polymerase sigma factor (sigma-70 family)